jgi:hypothetical protein
MGQGKGLSPRAKEMFQKLSNFLRFRFKQILIEFKQRFKSFVEIETWN